MRIPATDITAELVGRRLIDFSHTGEDPRDRDRTDRVGEGLDLGGGLIVGVRTEDPDNHVALLLGELRTDWVRDDAGQPVIGVGGSRERAPVLPLSGAIEIGFDANGWVEVED